MFNKNLPCETNLIESFIIKGLSTASIELFKRTLIKFGESEEEKTYYLRYNGIGVGNFLSKQEAREQLLKYVQEDLKKQIKDIEDKLTLLKYLEKTIGDDVFNLAFYRDYIKKD